MLFYFMRINFNHSPQQCKSDETGSSSLHFESNVVGEVNYEDVLLQFPMDLIPDPPDELIPKYSPKCSPVNETDVASSSTLDSVQKRSMLSSIVTCFSTERAWKMRTLLTVLYGVVAGLIECWTEVVYSHVVVMVLLDSGYLLYLVFTYDPTRSDTSVDPMGKLSLLKVPLMLIYSSFTWFDPLCLSVLLVGQFLYDLVIMLFVFILLRSMLLLLI